VPRPRQRALVQDARHHLRFAGELLQRGRVLQGQLAAGGQLVGLAGQLGHGQLAGHVTDLPAGLLGDPLRGPALEQGELLVAGRLLSRCEGLPVGVLVQHRRDLLRLLAGQVRPDDAVLLAAGLPGGGQAAVPGDDPEPVLVRGEHRVLHHAHLRVGDGSGQLGEVPEVLAHVVRVGEHLGGVEQQQVGIAPCFLGHGVAPSS
jgi:hypothetical protein